MSDAARSPADVGGTEVGATSEPLLSVCIPTRDRPGLFTRTLRSVVDQPHPDVEIVVSDNSSDPDDHATRLIVRELLGSWPGPWRYHRNDPPIGMVENHNACLELAGGTYVQILHDDDYLLPGGLASMLAHLTDDAPAALLFGVRVVDLQGRTIRRQGVRRTRDLRPRAALGRLLRESSYVRLPGMIVRREVYASLEGFDTTLGGPTDFDMWARVLARHPLRRCAADTCAYTVHLGANTTGMFNPDTIATMMGLFERVRRMDVLADPVVDRYQRDWFHQFILAGAWRSLRARDAERAVEVLGLFDVPSVSRLGWSPRWAPVRAALPGVTWIAARLSGLACYRRPFRKTTGRDRPPTHL